MVLGGGKYSVYLLCHLHCVLLIPWDFLEYTIVFLHLSTFHIKPSLDVPKHCEQALINIFKSIKCSWSTSTFGINILHSLGNVFGSGIIL